MQKKTLFFIFIGLLLTARFLYVTSMAIWHTKDFVSLNFAIITLLISTAPGLFFLTKIPQENRNLLFDISFTIGTSLSTTTLALWLLYATGLKTYLSIIILLALCAISLIYGITHLKPTFKLTLTESIALLISLLFVEGIYESVLGTPLTAWDAIVSWDKWAADIATRNWIGGYISGAYPPGIPLLQSIYYTLLVPPNLNPALSHAHLFMAGLFQIFPLLLLTSALTTAKHLKLNPIFTIAIYLGNSYLVFAMLKQIGYVDIPLAAAISATTSYLITQKSPTFLPTLPLIFLITFTKGNGLIFAIIALAIFWPKLSKQTKLATISAILIATTFYLQEWFCGIWTTLSEKSPFNHSLVVVSSHKDLVNYTLTHTYYVIRDLSNHYAYSPITTIITLLLITLAIINTNYRRPSLLLILTFLIWYFLSSYDYRNLLYIFPILAIILPASIQSRPIPIYAITILFTLTILQTRTMQMLRTPLSKYTPPTELTLTPDALREKIIGLPHQDYLRIQKLATAHILTPTPCYRYFDNKGVFPFQINALNYATPGDIAFSRKKGAIFTPPPPYKYLQNTTNMGRIGDEIYQIPKP